MRLIILSVFVGITLFGSMIKAPVFGVKENQGTIKIDMIQEGVSGFLVRHFNDDHSAIIANIMVVAFDADSAEATVEFTPYNGLKQNALPNGTWLPRDGDEAQLAFAYNRAFLIAPNREIYQDITSRAKSIDWVHPDTFATTLSYFGHPTPLAEDMQKYCNVSTIGLLYIYAAETLFTLDCKSLNVLQITTVQNDHKAVKLPFYSRIDTIREAWWGEGSSLLQEYDPYYIDLLKKHNKNNHLFQEFIKFDAIDKRPKLKIATTQERN
ncbi:MAG: plasminogen-binding N-terminal domain-containing protein [Campylobacterota bacterium]|nr:plasminogen-binding N-terminal domain-containing protein [Campylobacterota bacterium]